MSQTMNENLKIMSFGVYDYEFTANFSEQEINQLNIPLTQAKIINDIYRLIRTEGFRNKIELNSKNNLFNLLLFINKTNKQKTPIEFFALNSLFLPKELNFMQGKIKSEFEDNMIFLSESNILPPTQYKFSTQINSNIPQTFQVDYSEYLIYENKKKEFFEAKSEAAKKEEIQPKKEEAKKDDKIPDLKKKEEDKKPNDTKDHLPKGKNTESDKTNSMNLPNIDKPSAFEYENVCQIEGKDEEKYPIINPSELKKNQNSIIMFTRRNQKTISNDAINEAKKQPIFTYDKVDLNKQIIYNFEKCDYLVLDLNQFINNHLISLEHLYDYIKNNISKKYFNTTIIVIFPNPDLLKNPQNEILINFINLADIIIFDKKYAVKFCANLGYKCEDKNFEIRFMFLNEFKKIKYKPYKIALFIDCFNYVSVIVQETETNLITFHQEYKFNIGFRREYYDVIINNLELLKYVFIGTFLSRTILKESFDISFEVANDTFLKLVECFLQNAYNYPQDKDYFLHRKKQNKIANNVYNCIKPFNTINNQANQEMGQRQQRPYMTSDDEATLREDSQYGMNADKYGNNQRIINVLQNNLIYGEDVEKAFNKNLNNQQNRMNNKGDKNTHRNMTKISNDEVLLNKLMNSNSNNSLRNSSFEVKSKKLKPLNNKKNNKMQLSQNDMENFMSMMAQFNAGYQNFLNKSGSDMQPKKDEKAKLESNNEESKKEEVKKIESKKEEPKKEEVKKIEPKKEEPKKEEVKKEEPKKEEVKKIEPKKEEPKKEEPKKEEIKKEEPKKEEVKKIEPKKEEVKKDDAHNPKLKEEPKKDDASKPKQEIKKDETNQKQGGKKDESNQKPGGKTIV